MQAASLQCDGWWLKLTAVVSGSATIMADVLNVHRQIARVDHGELIVACAKGNHAALRHLYDAEAATMLGIATRILRRRATAEDAVHDAFVSIWAKSSSFDARLGNGRSWIYAILRNRTLNILRGETRLELVDSSTIDENVCDPTGVVETLAETDALRRCLEQLGDHGRDAIVLAYAYGLTHGEIAGRLGTPLGTTKARIRRALLQLKACLG